MKLLFIVYSLIENTNGISKKIQAQVKALAKSGVDVSLCHQIRYNGILYWAVDNKPIAEIGEGIQCHVRFYTFFRPISDYIISNKFDSVYLRYVHNASWYLNHFLHKLKKSGKTIYMEIPTYPYDGEYPNPNILKKIQLKIERDERKKFHRYIKKIITFSEDTEIFGIPTITLSNSVELDKIPIVDNKTRKDLRFVGVANINFWHGFDRLIKGIAEYYKKESHQAVYFDIVGDGALLNELKKLTSELNLNDYVKFHGPLSGTKLDEIFNQASIGVGCLGCHRKRITEVKSLKNVEYAARGIPFLYSEQNRDFDNKPYIIKATPDESIIDVEKVIKEFMKIKLSPNQIRATISNLSWDYQMKKIAVDLQS